MPRTQRLDLALLLLLAALTNLGYLALSDNYFFPDSATYFEPAKNLLAGHGFSAPAGVPDTMRTPGYPLLLALFHSTAKEPVPVLIFQHLLNLALTVAIYVVTKRATGSRFAAVAAGVVFAADPASIHYANKVLTETFFTAALFAAFLLVLSIVRGRISTARIIVAGLLLGALVLIRPVAVAWFVVVAAMFAFTLRVNRVRLIALFLASALPLPIAWGLRNRYHTGVFTISSIAGTNMIMQRGAGALAILDDGDFATDLADRQKELGAEADQRIREEEGVANPRVLDHAVCAVYYSEIGREVIREHPLAYAELTIRGLLVNLFDSDFDAIASVSLLHESVVELLLNAWNALVIFLALFGVAVLWKRDRPFAGLIFLTTGYFLFMSAGGESESRFRVPVVPLIAIAAGAGVGAARKAEMSSQNARNA
ncbi:MAG TPA: hypothetical protein VEZ11_10065 [Thermoanaerobaculia bacterium]|nr:hypothetical protein [Thermoanaerobaculia bacterium]